MTKLAICVPTFEHSDVVEQIICYSAKYLKKNEVDLYYYDSSRSDETKKAVNRINSAGYDNIHHIEVSPELNYGQKIDLIFSGFGLKDDYDYIWPIKDRTICNEYMLKLVLERCDAGRFPDVLIALTLGDIYEGDWFDMYDPVELYRLFAKQTTSLETVIYSRKTVLEGYEYGNSHNAPKWKNDFWHYDFLFNRLSEIRDPLISIISKEGACNAESSISKESGWKNAIWEVWIEEWIKVNFELPEMYSQYKLQAIRDTTSIDEILGKKETFEKLHEDGLLTKEIYEKYAEMWEFVTTVPVEEIERIVKGQGQ